MILLNIAHILPFSEVNGPGKRTVIWVQGCTINCKGCFNQNFLPHTQKYLVSPEELAKTILRLTQKHNCEGITLTGGEPFQQAEALNIFCDLIKSNGLSIVSFTGYNYSKLKRDENKNIQKLMEKIDILIAGPYRNNNSDQIRVWNANKDKDIIYLTEKYKNNSQKYENIELFMSEKDIEFTGFMEDEDKKFLENLFDSS